MIVFFSIFVLQNDLVQFLIFLHHLVEFVLQVAHYLLQLVVLLVARGRLSVLQLTLQLANSTPVEGNLA